MAFGCTITVDTGKLTETQAGFVWLATTDNFPVEAIDGGASSINNGGGNLRCYTDSSKTTQLPIEVVDCITGALPQVIVWGRSESLAVGSTVYIEADDTATIQPPVTDAFGRNSVWVDYVATYLLSDLSDSTGNHADIVSSGAVSSSDSKIGSGSYFFNGSAHLEESSFNYSGNVCFSSWVKNTDLSGTNNTVLSIGESGDPSYLWSLFRDAPDSDLGAISANPTTTIILSNTPALEGVWYKVDFVFDEFNSISLYLDGALLSSVALGSIPSFTSPRFNIGARSDALSNNMVGNIQASSVRSLLPSVSLISDEYTNQSSPETFWTTSAWEEQGGGGVSLDITESLNSFQDSASISISRFIEASITETLRSFVESSSIVITEQINNVPASITETLNPFTDNSQINISSSLSLQVTESLSSFIDSSNIDIRKELELSITEVLNSFTDSARINIPIDITLNPKRIIRAVRKNNTVRVSKKQNTIRVK